MKTDMIAPSPDITAEDKAVQDGEKMSVAAIGEQSTEIAPLEIQTDMNPEAAASKVEANTATVTAEKQSTKGTERDRKTWLQQIRRLWQKARQNVKKKVYIDCFPWIRFPWMRMIILSIIQFGAIIKWANYALPALVPGKASLQPRTFFPLYPDGLASLALAGGVAGTLITWLLQHIRTEDCGVELGTVFKEEFPCYPWNLLFFAASTAICLFLSNTKAITFNPVYRIVLWNMVAMMAGLVYICWMCWDFLFNQNRRKQFIHRYLQKDILLKWKQTKYLTWDTIELEQIATDFSVCAHWEEDNPAWWFFEEWIDRLLNMEGDAGHVLKIWLQQTTDLFALLFEKCKDYQADRILGCAIAAFIHSQNSKLEARITEAYRGFIIIWCSEIYSNPSDQGTVDELILSLFQCVFSATVHAVNLTKKRADNRGEEPPTQQLNTLAGDSIACCAAALIAAAGGFGDKANSVEAYFKSYRDRCAQLGLEAKTAYTDPELTKLARYIVREIGKEKPIIEEDNPTTQEQRNVEGFGGKEALV